MEDRFDFPIDMFRVTAGKGNESLLLFGNKGTALFEAGMAYPHKNLIANIKNCLAKRGLQNLDYVLLTHSHYDHIGALPYIIEEWPEVKVVASLKTKKVFESKGAKKTMLELSKAAACKYGGTKVDPNMDLLRVDIVAKDDQIIDLGDRRIRAIETKGHTDCSMSYAIEPEKILLLSETTGVFREDGVVSSEIVKSYKDSISSCKKCMAYGPSRIIVPHYGIIPAEKNTEFFVGFLVDAAFEKRMIIDSYKKTGSLDETLREFKDRYWKEEYEEGQPKEAFEANAGPIVENMLREEGLI